MYSYNEVETLLSNSAKSILKESINYEPFAAEATATITSYTNYDADKLKPFCKMAFVYIIENLVANRLNTLSAEFLDRVKSNFTNAFTLLDRISNNIYNADNVNNQVSGIGYIESDY